MMEKQLRIVNIVLAVCCVLGIGFGIGYSVVISQLVSFIYEKIVGRSSAGAFISTILWIWGLTYIIPGVIGLIAVGVRKRGAYIAHLVFSLVGVGILIYLFIRGSLATGVQSGSRGFCKSTTRGCECETPAMTSLLQYFSCEEVNKLVRMGIASDATFWCGFVITIIAAVVSGIASHKARQVELEATRGMVMAPGVNLQQYPHQGQPPSYPPQGNPYVYSQQGNPPVYQPQGNPYPHVENNYPVKS